MSISKTLRETIARNASKVFDAQRLDLKVREDSLAREAYLSVHTADEIKAVDAAPENWFRLDACLRFNVAGMNIILRTAEKGVRVPYQPRGEQYGSYGCNMLGVIKAGDLADRIMALENDKQELKDKTQSAYNNVLAMLGSVHSLKKLEQAWPEGRQFYAQYLEQVVVAGVPQITIQDLNEQLGLAA